MNETCQNNDKEIWRKVKGDYYSPSIHVTDQEGIGINCHGSVIVAPVERWLAWGQTMLNTRPSIKQPCRVPVWKWKMAMWLLRPKDLRGQV